MQSSSVDEHQFQWRRATKYWDIIMERAESAGMKPTVHCSLCHSPGATMVTCPYNPNARGGKPERHPKAILRNPPANRAPGQRQPAEPVKRMLRVFKEVPRLVPEDTMADEDDDFVPPPRPKVTLTRRVPNKSTRPPPPPPPPGPLHVSVLPVLQSDSAV